MAGHSAWMAQLETVANGHGFMSLPPDCAQAASSPGMPKVGDEFVLVQGQLYSTN